MYMIRFNFIKFTLIGLLILRSSPVLADVSTVNLNELSSNNTKVSTFKNNEDNSRFNINSELPSSISKSEVNVVSVATESEFWSAILNQTVSTILLTKDIVANPANRLSDSKNMAGAIKRNLIIDGQGHNLSYNTSAYTTPILYAGTSDITMTFQNMNMGSKNYPNNNYYGIFTVQQANVTLNIKDFSYYAENGAQPFYADNNVGSTINFYGKNNFTANGANAGGEFIERFRTINFKAGSTTNVEQDNNGATSAIWSVSTVINLETNAKFYVKSSKDNFIYSNATINLADNAYLSYENKLGTYYPNKTAGFGSGSVVINGGKGSEVDFISNENSMNLAGTVVNSNGMKAIYAVNNLGNTASKNKLIVNRTDNNAGIYDLNALSSTGVQSRPISEVDPNTSINILPSLYNNGKSFLYSLKPTVLSAKFESEVGSHLSDLNATIITDEGFFRNVKVSNSKLYNNENVNSEDSQAMIDEAPIIPTTISTNSVATISSNILGGQKKYIYYNVQFDNKFPGYILKSPWMESVVTQAKYSEVIIPDSTMIFNQPIPGPFTTESEYSIKNSGNVPLKIRPTAVKDNNMNVTLVESLFEPDKQQVSLSVHGSSKNDSHDWNFKNLDSTTLTIDPYFTDNNYVNYAIKGNYSGPLIGVQKVNYTITFDWSQ